MEYLELEGIPRDHSSPVLGMELCLEICCTPVIYGYQQTLTFWEHGWSGCAYHQSASAFNIFRILSQGSQL